MHRAGLIRFQKKYNVMHAYHERKEAEMATLDTIKTVLNDNLDIEPDSVTEESTFESLGIDSLDMAELTCSLEEELDIDFGEPEGLTTVGDLVEYIDSL